MAKKKTKKPSTWTTRKYRNAFREQRGQDVYTAVKLLAQNEVRVNPLDGRKLTLKLYDNTMLSQQSLRAVRANYTRGAYGKYLIRMGW